MSKNILHVNWKKFNGAATNKKILKLREMYVKYLSVLLINACIVVFDEEPSVKREDIEKGEIVKLKQPMHTIPAFSIDGVGNLFIRWLRTTCGGGKQVRQAKQIAKKSNGICDGVRWRSC